MAVVIGGRSLLRLIVGLPTRSAAEGVELDLVFDMSSSYHPGLSLWMMQKIEKRRGSCSFCRLGHSSIAVGVDSVSMAATYKLSFPVRGNPL